MKKVLLFMAAMLGALTACEKVDLPSSENGGGNFEPSKQFTFTVKGDFLNPTFSRANSYMTADGVEMTDLWVVDVVGGEIKQMLHQTSADAEWGSPKMSLTLGTHHVMFLASRTPGRQGARLSRHCAAPSIVPSSLSGYIMLNVPYIKPDKQ